MCALTMSAKVQTLFLDKIMSTCWWKIYYVNEINMWSCSYTTWKLSFWTMVDAMTSCTTSCVFICLLPCAHCNKWMFINQLMECVHTQWRGFFTNGWGSLSPIQNVVGTKYCNGKWNMGVFCEDVNHIFAFGPNHEKRRAWWTSYVFLKRMLKKACRCMHLKNGIIYISVEIVYPWIVPKIEDLLKLRWARNHKLLMSFERKIVTKKRRGDLVNTLLVIIKAC